MLLWCRRHRARSGDSEAEASLAGHGVRPSVVQRSTRGIVASKWSTPEPSQRHYRGTDRLQVEIRNQCGQKERSVITRLVEARVSTRPNVSYFVVKRDKDIHDSAVSLWQCLVRA